MSVSMIWDHLSLVLSALILAVAAGVPLGLAAYLSPKVGKVLLWVVDLIQTIPALALLGVIMVITGPGSPPLWSAWLCTPCCPSPGTPPWACPRCPPT